MSGNTFSKMFGQSPFTSLQEHMRVVVACAAEVRPLIEALSAGDQQSVIAVKDKIFELEAEADRIKHDLRANLPKSLFMPVDRRDLLEVLQLQDAIANVAQDIAGLLIERKMSIPEFLRVRPALYLKPGPLFSSSHCRQGRNCPESFTFSPG